MGLDVIFLLKVIAILLVVIFISHWRFWRGAQRFEKIVQRQADGDIPDSWFVHGHPWIHRLGYSLEAIGKRQKEVDSELADTAFNLKAVMGSMVEGVMVLDHNNRISLVNEEFLELFDLKYNPLGRTALETLQEANIELFLREVMASGQEANREVALRIKGRDDRQMEINAVPIFDEHGKINGLVAVFHDVSRIKKLERVRQEFVAAVSHELRTPLSIFRGYLETLVDSPNLSQNEIKRVLAIMTRHSDRLNALVEDLFTLSRLESGRMEIHPVAIHLEPLLKQILEDYRHRIEENEATVQLDLDDDLPPVEADRLKFEQVLFNLLDNAMAYSRPPRQVEISAWLENQMVHVKVRDNGLGIPSADVPHIFERFYRVDKGRSRDHGGTGLGLSIVKHILDQHGGSVSAASELGKWTAITLQIPISQEEGIWQESPAALEVETTPVSRQAKAPAPTKVEKEKISR